MPLIKACISPVTEFMLVYYVMAPKILPLKEGLPLCDGFVAGYRVFAVVIGIEVHAAFCVWFRLE